MEEYKLAENGLPVAYEYYLYVNNRFMCEGARSRRHIYRLVSKLNPEGVEMSSYGKKRVKTLNPLGQLETFLTVAKHVRKDVVYKMMKFYLKGQKVLPPCKTKAMPYLQEKLGGISSSRVYDKVKEINLHHIFKSGSTKGVLTGEDQVMLQYYLDSPYALAKYVIRLSSGQNVGYYGMVDKLLKPYDHEFKLRSDHPFH